MACTAEGRCVTPAGTSNELDVQNEWEKYTHTLQLYCIVLPSIKYVVFSDSEHWLPTPKKLLYTVANPARGLLNRGKKKSLVAPHPRTLYVRRK